MWCIERIPWHQWHYIARRRFAVSDWLSSLICVWPNKNVLVTWPGLTLFTPIIIDEMNGVLGRARYFSVTEAPHNIEYLRVSGEETFCFFGTWMPKWGSNPRSPTFQAGSFNHCTRAPAPIVSTVTCFWYMYLQSSVVWVRLKSVLYCWDVDPL